MNRVLTALTPLVLSGWAFGGPYAGGIDLLAQGKYADARFRFDRELKVRPANTRAYTYAATASEKIPDLERAMPLRGTGRSCSKSARIPPNANSPRRIFSPVAARPPLQTVRRSDPPMWTLRSFNTR